MTAPLGDAADQATPVPTVSTLSSRPMRAAMIWLTIGFLCALIHWLIRHPSRATLLDVLHWGAVIPAIIGSAIAFRNRSHRSAAPLIAFGLLLLATSLRVRSNDPIPMNPDLVLNVAASPAAIPDIALSIAIPDATVELAGISSDWNGTLTSDWWRPTGVMVKKRTWSIATDYVPRFTEGYSRRLVVHIHGSEPRAHLLAFDFDGEPGACVEGAVTTADANPNEWLALTRIFGGNQVTTAVRMLVGSGNFERPDSASITRDDPDGTAGAFGDLQFTTRIIDDANPDVTVLQLDCHGNDTDRHDEFRVSVIDDKGLQHFTKQRNRHDFNLATELAATRTYLFEVPAEGKIRQIVVERRPSYLIELYDISLRAGHHTAARAILADKATTSK